MSRKYIVGASILLASATSVFLAKEYGTTIIIPLNDKRKKSKQITFNEVTKQDLMSEVYADLLYDQFVHQSSDLKYQNSILLDCWRAELERMYADYCEMYRSKIEDDKAKLLEIESELLDIKDYILNAVAKNETHNYIHFLEDIARYRSGEGDIVEIRRSIYYGLQKKIGGSKPTMLLKRLYEQPDSAWQDFLDKNEFLESFCKEQVAINNIRLDPTYRLITFINSAEIHNPSDTFDQCIENLRHGNLKGALQQINCISGYERIIAKPLIERLRRIAELEQDLNLLIMLLKANAIISTMANQHGYKQYD